MSDQGFNGLMGMEFETVTGDEVVIRMTVRPDHHQPYGIVHGGVWCTLVETAASIGAGTWLGERGNVVGVSNHTNFLRAVRTGHQNPVVACRVDYPWADRRDLDQRLHDHLVAQLLDPSRELGGLFPRPRDHDSHGPPTPRGFPESLLTA